MNNSGRNISEGRGMGVGYVTLTMLFAVICLTVLASLSYQAARANDKLNEKSVSFTTGLYEADSRAKVTLSQLDEWAMLSHDSGFFNDSFPACCEEKDDLDIKKVPDGFEVAFTEDISDNLMLSAKITFFAVPQNGCRYRIDEWKNVAVTDDTADETLGVWDGSLPGQI